MKLRFPCDYPTTPFATSALKWARSRLIGLSALLAGAAPLRAEDWNQWRGPNRNGVLSHSVRLLDSIPNEGLTELWASETIPTQDDGGFGSPVIAGGRVYLSLVWHTDVPSETRTFTDIVLRNLGDYNLPAGIGAERAAKLEADRLALPRTVRGAKLEEAAAQWIEANLTAPQQMLGSIVKGRFRKGSLAIPLADYDKMRAMRDKPFPTDADFKQWVEGQGFADFVKKEIYDKVPPTMRVAEDTVVCLDLASGKTLWRAKAPGEPKGRDCSGTPAVVGGRVFALGSAHLHAVDASSGALLWSAPLPKSASGSSPLVADGVVVVNAGRLVAFAADTGRELWQADRTGGGHSSPVAWSAIGRTIVICNSRDEIVAVDLKSGKIAWTAPGGGDSTPAILGDKLAVLSDKPKLGFIALEISADGAKQLWNSPMEPARSQSSPIIHDNQVFLMEDNFHYCWDLATGSLQWRAPVTGEIASPVLADGKLFALVNKGTRLQVVKATGPDRMELGNVKIDAAWVPSPALSAGRLVLRMKDRLKCFDLAAPRLPATN